MAIQVQCPYCKKPSGLDDTMRHQKVTCPHCQRIFVPVNCPHCKTTLALDDTMLHSKITCPRQRCQGVFVPDQVIYQANRDRVAKMGKWFKLILWAGMGSLPLFFAWLKFQDVDFVSLGSRLDVDFLLKFSIAVYYLSWCLGAPWEVTDMESFYADAPNRGRIPVAVYMWIALLLGVAAVLCFVHSFTVLAPILAGFWAANVIGWTYRGSVVNPTVNTSILKYEEFQKYDKLESLLVFNELNGGTWHWWRFGAGAVMLGCVNLLAFSPLSQILGDAVGGVPGDVILALGVLSFILLVEGWIWFQRIQSRRCYRLITKLTEKYDFSLKTAVALTPAPAEPVVWSPKLILPQSKPGRKRKWSFDKWPWTKP
jgi:uncharacterized protein YbaR (Trm112 family)